MCTPCLLSEMTVLVRTLCIGVQMCASTNVDVRGQLWGLGSFLLSCGFETEVRLSGSAASTTSLVLVRSLCGYRCPEPL